MLRNGTISGVLLHSTNKTTIEKLTECYEAFQDKHLNTAQVKFNSEKFQTSLRYIHVYIF